MTFVLRQCVIYLLTYLNVFSRRKHLSVYCFVRSLLTGGRPLLTLVSSSKNKRVKWRNNYGPSSGGTKKAGGP